MAGELADGAHDLKPEAVVETDDAPPPAEPTPPPSEVRFWVASGGIHAARLLEFWASHDPAPPNADWDASLTAWQEWFGVREAT